MVLGRTILISAGETSGDIHGAGLVAELKKKCGGYDFVGLGGEQLKSEGVQLFYHCRDLAALGFLEVAARIKFFIGVKNEITRYLTENRPDLVVLVDYPGLNLKIAEEAHKLNIPVVYFIMPQVWAWKPKRVIALKNYCRLLISILPFEVDFFKKHDTKIEYVGHPLIDVIPPPRTRKEVRFFLELPNDMRLLALLPGSRQQEIERNLPVMVNTFRKLTKRFENLDGVIIKAPDLDRKLYQKTAGELPPNLEITDQHKYEYIQASNCALVASGTATLETALCLTPAVVMYRTTFLTYLLARMFIKIDSIALANLVAQEKVFPELVQFRARSKSIAYELRKYLEDPDYNELVRSKLSNVRDRLKPKGAYARAADLIRDRVLRH